MDTDTRVVTVRNRQTGCYRRNKLTRKDNVMPKMKLNTPPFILVPQLRVDASSALCRDDIIITFMFLYQSTMLTYTFCGAFFRMPVFLLSSINVSHGCVTADYVQIWAETNDGTCECLSSLLVLLSHDLWFVLLLKVNSFFISVTLPLSF